MSAPRPIFTGFARALLILAVLIAIPFFIAKFIADMTGERH